MHVIVVTVVCVPRTQTSPHRSTDASAVPPAGDGADHRSCADPEQAAGNGVLAGIVGVRVGGCHPGLNPK